MAKQRGVAAEAAVRVPWVVKITHHAQVAPETLLVHPLNARRHSKEQLAALAGSLDDLGWIDEIHVNARTGLMFDGHARLAVALARGEATVPVAYSDLSPEDERKALLLKDAIGAMASFDDDATLALLAQVETTDAGLAALIDTMRAEHAPSLDDLPPAGDASLDDVPASWGVIVACATEADQVRALTLLGDAGFTDVKALLS